MVDAAALVVGDDLSHCADAFYTVEFGMDEMRDKAAREKIENLPYEIQVRAASKEAQKAGKAFRKRNARNPAVVRVKWGCVHVCNSPHIQ